MTNISWVRVQACAWLRAHTGHVPWNQPLDSLCLRDKPVSSLEKNHSIKEMRRKIWKGWGFSSVMYKGWGWPPPQYHHHCPPNNENKGKKTNWHFHNTVSDKRIRAKFKNILVPHFTGVLGNWNWRSHWEERYLTAWHKSKVFKDKLEYGGCLGKLSPGVRMHLKYLLHRL